MKKLVTFTLMVSMVFFATAAFADRGYGYCGKGSDITKGERIDRHLNRQGDRVEHRFEHKAYRAEARGNNYKASRLRAKGEQINRHLDRKGDQIRARLDNHDYRSCTNRNHKHIRPKVAAHSHGPIDTYFGVVINQPGLLLNWGFYD